MIPRALAAALVTALLAASCSRPAPPPPAAPESNPFDKLPKDVINERQSILDMTRGGTIVSRTGESLLQFAAVNTIDGSIVTTWMSPPHDFPQSITIGLASRSRIDRVGFRSLRGAFDANHLTFEQSLDGTTWKPLASMTSKHVDTAQWADVAPTEAAFLRVTIVDAQKPDADVRLNSLLAHGTPLEPPRNAPIDGCWSINGSVARFVQHGTRMTGSASIGMPFDISGANDGKLWRLQWLRGNDYGYALLTTAADGRHLSALVWHEEPIPLFVATPWFGEPQACAGATAAPVDDVQLRFLRRRGHVALFALQFDDAGTLDVNASADELAIARRIIAAAPVPLRIVAHEFRQPDARRNKAIAEREIATVRDALTRAGADLARVTFAAAGSDAPRHEPGSDAARAIYSAVEIEVRR